MIRADEANSYASVKSLGTVGIALASITSSASDLFGVAFKADRSDIEDALYALSIIVIVLSGLVALIEVVLVAVKPSRVLAVLPTASGSAGVGVADGNGLGGDAGGRAAAAGDVVKRCCDRFVRILFCNACGEDDNDASGTGSHAGRNGEYRFGQSTKFYNGLASILAFGILAVQALVSGLKTLLPNASASA